MFCGACNQQMNTGARFCSHCGTPVPVQTGWNASARRLVRPRFGRMISGVCTGIANAYGWDPVLVRVCTVLLFFAGHICVLIAYIAAWVVMPNEPVFWQPPVMPGYTGGAPTGGVPAS